MLITNGSTSKKLMILMVDSTDHITPKTGLTLTVTKSKNGGAFAALSGSVAEVANGWYAITLAAGDVDTSGIAVFHATGTAADPGDVMVEVIDTDFFTAAAGVWAAILEGAFTAGRILRIIAAGVAGKDSGGPGGPVFRNLADTQDQITGTADASGNRSAATYGP